MTHTARASTGFGLAELLLGLAIGLVATAAVAIGLRTSLHAVQHRGESVDVVQRARAVSESMGRAVADAGGGFSLASPGGWVSAAAPRLVPARFAVHTTDPAYSSFSDRFTVLAARESPRESTLAVPMGSADALLTIAPLVGCREASPSCDLDVGDLALVADRYGRADLVAISAVSGNLVAHEPRVLSHAYDPADGVRVIPIQARAFYFDAAAAQIREYRGRSPGLVMADDVVGFRVSYYGAPDPPSGRAFLPGRESCVATAEGDARLPPLTANAGTLVELTAGHFQDGPFCGAGALAFDADLLRVRLVRFMIRVQASDPAVRGRSPELFARPGRAAEPGLEVPDRELTIDVAVRNALTVG